MDTGSSWSAPGRVNLVGEHTDYNGGLALPFAIGLRTTATVRRRDDVTVSARSAQHPDEPVEVELAAIGPGRPGGWAAYAAGVLAVLHRRGHAVSGVDIDVDGGVPPGAGLSSSAALTCAVAAAAADVFDLDLDRDEVAAVARAAENDVVGVPCGSMDQLTAMHGRSGHALLLDFASGTTTPVPLRRGRSLVVVDTHVRHELADGAYAERRRRCEAAAAALGVQHLSQVTDLEDALARLDDDLRRVVRHVVTENARVLSAANALRDGDWATVGATLLASHRSLRDDYAVSTPELDLAVDVLVSVGADGARLTGGGFGGSVVGVVDPALVPELEPELSRAFAVAGQRPPSVREVTAADGARREPVSR